MEPFKLTLQQVTFEEGDLSPTQELDSFSNVVHYDSKFSVSPSTAALTYAQTCNQSIVNSNRRANRNRGRAVAQPSRVKTSQIYSQSVCTPCILTPQTNPLYCEDDSSLINPHSCFVDDPEGFFTRKTRVKVPDTDIRTLFQVSKNTASLKKSRFSKKVINPVMSSSDSGLADSSATDGQQSFETVAEALHLQWSVIGDKKLTPAPPEVVAQIVAEAEKKIKGQASPVPQSVESQIPVSLGGSANIFSESNKETLPASPKHQSQQEQVRSHLPPTRELTSPGSSGELIRIHVPTESITTTKEKTSWFGGKSEPNHQEVMSQGSKVSSDLEDKESVSSAASELESFGQTETEKFLKSLPPVKQLDLNVIVPKSVVKTVSHSPPVKETSFRPLPSLTSPVVTSGTLNDSSEMLSASANLVTNDSLEMFNDSEILPVPDHVVTSTPNKPTFVMPQIGPLFNRPRPVVHKPRIDDDSKVVNKKIVEVMKEKAKLEGQLEMLSLESQATLQERAELQAQVASLKSQLMSNKGNDQEMDSLKTQLNKLERAKSLMEQSLGSAHKFLEEKTSEAKILQEELQLSQEASDKLQVRMKELKDDLRAKEMTVQALKNKIAELYVEVQTVLQAKMESDNAARSARNDLTSLMNTKNWYQNQLQAAQEARAKLQHELTTLQAQASSQGSIIERLKTDNAKLRQQVKEAQQKALKEKELLAKHLEKIETDMLNREAAFQEIQRERNLLENTFDTKLQSVEDEKSRYGAMLQMTTDLENQLDKAHTDLKKKQNQIITLENEQIEMMKKLALSQECVIEKDGVIEDLNQRLIQVESGLKAFQSSVGVKDTEVWKLREEKAAIEISLNAALEEKLTVDKALDTLKGDMGKVEKSFRLMKQELGNKNTDYNTITKEKQALQDELDKIKEKLERELTENRIIQRGAEDKSACVDDLRIQKVQLEEKLKLVEEEVSSLKQANSEYLRQKEAVDLELCQVRQQLSQTHNQLVTAEQEKPLQSTQNHDMAEENENLKKLMTKNENQMQKEITKQKAKVARLNCDLKSLQNELTDRQTLLEGNIEVLSSKLREVTTEKERLETEVSMAKARYDLLLEQQDATKSELPNMMLELDTVKLQKQTLESQLIELQRMKEMEVEQYQKQLSLLDEELTEQRETQANAEQQEEVNQRLSLELEKEKGRVAGLMQTNDSLKQHVSELEDALARRESSLLELQSQTEDALKTKAEEEEEYIQRIKNLQEDLQQEKEGQRDLRKQIGSKISENKKLKRNFESMKAEKEGLQQDLEHGIQQSKDLRTELENSKQLQLLQQGQVTSLEAENKGLQHQLERARLELAENLAREPIIQEQIANLQWQYDQKCKELESMQGQTALASDRQNLEVDDLHRNIQEQKQELESLRREITQVKEEKASQQAEISELRATLKASIQHHKLTKKLNKKSQNGEITTKDMGTQADIVLPPLPFDLDAVEKLVQESAVRALESKPLDNLQSCLTSLRSEISGLQQLVEDHSTVVTTSNQSWSSVESQFNELRQIVKTISSTTEQSSTTDSLAAAAVQAASGVIFDV